MHKTNFQWIFLFLTLITGAVKACSPSKYVPTTIYLDSYGTTKYIKSPNYPITYPSNTDCYWRVVAPAGFKIKYTFDRNFELEYSAGCYSDYVQLFDSRTSSSYGDEIGKYCGTASPSAASTKDNYLFIRFTSDYEFVSFGIYDGFSLKVEAYEGYYQSSISVGGIIGIIFGCIVGLIGFIMCICCCLSSSKKNHGGQVIHHNPNQANGGRIAIISISHGNQVHPHHDGMVHPPPYSANPPMPQPYPPPYPPPPEGTYPPPASYPPPPSYSAPTDAAYPPPPPPPR